MLPENRRREYLSKRRKGRKGRKEKKRRKERKRDDDIAKQGAVNKKILYHYMKFFGIDFNLGQEPIWTSILSNNSPFLLHFFSVEKKNKRNKKGIYQFTNIIQNLSAKAAAKAKAEILEPKNAEILACHRAITIEVIEVCDNDSFNKLMDEKIKEYHNHLYDDPVHNSSICSSLKDLEMIKNKAFDLDFRSQMQAAALITLKSQSNVLNKR